MSEFVVHLVPGSPFGRCVQAMLEERGAAYRLVALPSGGSKQPEHLARHPFGRVPVLEHGDFRLYETQAILRYLDRILPGPALTPGDPKVAARMDQLMNVSDWYLFQGVNNVIGFHRIVGPMLLGLQPDEAAIAAAMPKAHTVFGEIARFLGDGQYLVGDQLTLADLHVGPQLSFITMTPEWKSLTASLPNLTTWMDRIDARPSFQATTMQRTREKAMTQAA